MLPDSAELDGVINDNGMRNTKAVKITSIGLSLENFTLILGSSSPLFRATLSRCQLVKLKKRLLIWTKKGKRMRNV